VTLPAAVPGRAVVVGTGLIGGSVGLSLRSLGWKVSGIDRDPAREARALEVGAVDVLGRDAGADLVVVATPLGAVEGAVREALSWLGSEAVVTDVAGVKAPLARAIDDPRYVGGHPMAGSEADGLEGAVAGLFTGATWVLTPTERTAPEAFARVRDVCAALGSEVVALPPERHDELVAVVSHVPHLVAAALVRQAAAAAAEQPVLMRLAAGGFRDMTRIAAGHPGIWPDVCAANAPAILAALDDLEGQLAELRSLVAAADRGRLFDVLAAARRTRRHLPTGARLAEHLAELRVVVPDEPGVLAAVTTCAGERGVNLFDLEIAHSAERDGGLLLLVVDARAATDLAEVLRARGFRVTVEDLP
jgi:prephenate dehydrogenase